MHWTDEYINRVLAEGDEMAYILEVLEEEKKRKSKYNF